MLLEAAASSSLPPVLVGVALPDAAALKVAAWRPAPEGFLIVADYVLMAGGEVGEDVSAVIQYHPLLDYRPEAVPILGRWSLLPFDEKII